MGHHRLSTLPKTRNWQDIVDMLEADASVAEISQKTANALDNQLEKVKNDPLIARSLWLLMQLPLDNLQCRCWRILPLTRINTSRTCF